MTEKQPTIIQLVKCTDYHHGAIHLHRFGEIACCAELTFQGTFRPERYQIYGNVKNCKNINILTIRLIRIRK